MTSKLQTFLSPLKKATVQGTLFAMAALAALTTAGQAHAQSAITVFGIIDVSLSHGGGSVSNFNGLRNGGLATSQLGFRGVEDLGGGLKAGFWLEAEIVADSGAGLPTNTNNQSNGFGPGATSQTPGGLSFNRRSIVSLGGPWGQVFMGRDYNATFWNNAIFDPFGVNGAGTSQAFLSRFAGGGPLSPATGAYMNGGSGLYTRASNSIAYAYGFAPNGSTAVGNGLFAHVMYFLGENPSSAVNKKDGSGAGVRVGYADGPVNVAAAYMASQFQATDPSTITPATFSSVSLGDIQTYSLAGSYDFGIVKPRAMVVRDTFGPRSGKGGLLGVTAPLGLGELRAAYSTYKTSLGASSSKVAVGYVHYLSKRTAVYTTYAHLGNKGGAAQSVNGSVTAANADSSGYDFGLKHSF